MRHEKLIDTLLYKRLDESRYKVKNAETGEIFELGRAIVSFMNKLDGKTDPFMINTCLSDFEIEEVLDFLWANELVTKKKWKKIGFLTYGIPLFKVKTTQKMRIVSKILNFLLMISFVPIFIVGLYAVKDIYKLIDKNDFSYLLGLCVGTALGTILHECGHAIAGLGYNAHLFSCGFMIGITPGAFVEIDDEDEHIKSSLKKAQISAAGVEMNLLLCGLSMICMRLVNSAISLFLGGIAFSNLLLASVNLLPIIGVDGSQIINKLIGGDDLILYSDILITDKSFLRHSFSNVRGLAEIYSCALTILSQISYPILIIANILYIWSILR